MAIERNFIKDPDALLDYGIDWSAWLVDGDSLATAVWTVPTGLTLEDEALSGTSTVAWLSGGTAGSDYEVSCLVTTNDGRTDERTIVIKVRER